MLRLVPVDSSRSANSFVLTLNLKSNNELSGSVKNSAENLRGHIELLRMEGAWGGYWCGTRMSSLATMGKFSMARSSAEAVRRFDEIRLP